MATEVAAKRFTVEQFQRMAEAGVFDEDDRLELLDGEIFQMNPVGRRHVATVNRLTRGLAGVVGGRSLISLQNRLVAGAAAEPEAGVALLPPPTASFEGD